MTDPSLRSKDGANGKLGARWRSGWPTAWTIPGGVWAVVVSRDTESESAGALEARARALTGHYGFTPAVISR